jgi:hypothetical protein
MIMPKIHSNGSDPLKLIEGYTEAIEAVRNAIDKLEACFPHARDYYINNYVNNASATKIAMEEHLARIQKLIGIWSELKALVENVQDQVNAREEQRK